MPHLHVVELPCSNGIVADTHSMSLATLPGSGGVETLANDALARTAIVEFFTTAAPGNVDPMGLHIATSRSRTVNACKVKTYDITGHLSGTPHGSPIGDSVFTLPASDSTKGLPDEVAVVVRLETLGRSSAPVEAPDSGDPGTEVDRPKQRQTGRFYFGPISALGGHSVESGGGNRPSPTFIGNLLDAVEHLRDQLAGIVGGVYHIGVWSRQSAQIATASFAAVDDAWDIQRRRGPKPTVLTRRQID